ncbi:MAG: 2-oxoglutarate and iron-dependent oxygenase domain-containing protein [Novosphingobium sp.]|nr:2-oxoglutarate and iron-dependent oxygenase domain-containing protein [Novosphingobium sp.]
MSINTIPVLSLHQGDRSTARRLGESFRNFGFAVIEDHMISPDLIDRAWKLSERFFALPEDEKRRYHMPGLAGARGFTPFGVEVAKGASAHDLKEFWHIGRDLPQVHPLAGNMPANIWPTRPPGFRETFSALFAEFDRVGTVLMSHIAVDLGLDPAWFDSPLADGNSVLRLLHYPPMAGDPGEALRAGPHEDINIVTLLLGAQEAGLELLGKNGEWLAISPPPGSLVVNIGDMLQRLTNHMLPSTTHRVRNPSGESARHSRYAMPFFVHLRSDFRIQTLPQCVSEEQHDRYPHAITADQFLQERLREIGLCE